MPIAYVLLTVEPGKEDDVLQKLRAIPEIEEAHRVYGVYDTIVKVNAPSPEKLKEIITWKIRKIENVKSTLTMLVVEQ
ncbi:MAG: Lrp/AsnC ligand binding domain-containing protein [Nitrososphaeria archaeon]